MFNPEISLIRDYPVYVNVCWLKLLCIVSDNVMFIALIMAKLLSLEKAVLII